MAYAVIENKKIQVYEILPKSYHSKIANVLGGFDKLPNEELAKHGFYPVEEAIIEEPILQTKGDIYFDKLNKVFKYKIKEIPHPEIDLIRESTLNKLEYIKKSMLSDTDGDVMEALELGKEVPIEIATQRLSIRNQYKIIKEKINNLTTKKQLLTFEINIT